MLSCNFGRTARTAVSLFVLALLVMTAASASTIVARFDGVSPSSTALRDVGDGAGFVGVTLGRFNLTRTGGSFVQDPFPAGPGINAFCFEPRQFISAGSTYTFTVDALENGPTNVAGGIGVAKANDVRELFGRFYPDFNAPLTALPASALQAALWEIIREVSAPYDVSTGNTQFMSESLAGTLALANSYLSALDGTGPQAKGLFLMLNHDNQDMIAQTPEPSSLALGALGLASLWWARRFKR